MNESLSTILTNAWTIHECVLLLKLFAYLLNTILFTTVFPVDKILRIFDSPSPFVHKFTTEAYVVNTLFVYVVYERPLVIIFDYCHDD